MVKFRFCWPHIFPPVIFFDEITYVAWFSYAWAILPTHNKIAMGGVGNKIFWFFSCYGQASSTKTNSLNSEWFYPNHFFLSIFILFQCELELAGVALLNSYHTLPSALGTTLKGKIKRNVKIAVKWINKINLQMILKHLLKPCI